MWNPRYPIPARKQLRLSYSLFLARYAQAFSILNQGRDGTDISVPYRQKLRANARNVTSSCRTTSGCVYWLTLPGWYTSVCSYSASIWPPRIRILRSQLPARFRLSDAQRSTLAEIGRRLGRKQLAEVARRQTSHHPGLVSAADCSKVRWLPATQGAGSASRGSQCGNARCPHGPGELWLGCDRIVGALANLGDQVPIKPQGTS